MFLTSMVFKIIVYSILYNSAPECLNAIGQKIRFLKQHDS